MDSATLDEGAAALAAATLGPWVRRDCVVYFGRNAGGFDLYRCPDPAANAAFIVWAHEHLADLIAAARQAQDNAKDAERGRWVRCKWPEMGDVIDAAIAAATPGKGGT